MVRVGIRAQDVQGPYRAHVGDFGAVESIGWQLVLRQYLVARWVGEESGDVEEAHGVPGDASDLDLVQGHGLEETQRCRVLKQRLHCCGDCCGRPE